MKYKKFLSDSILNIIVTFVPLVILQFLIYPFIAQTISKEEYGIMIAVYSFIYMMGGTLGTELNKERLVKTPLYSEKKLVGDFNIILVANLIIATLACLGFCIVTFEKINLFVIALTTGACVLIALNSYLEVSYRLELNYIKIAKVNLLAIAGYLIGSLLFIATHQWIWIFLTGFVIQLIFNLKNTSLLKEPFKKTELFKSSFKGNIHLVLAGVLNRVLLYGDKILLLPIGGSAMVSIYYTASLIGKTILMSIEPINTVLLSYLVKWKKISKRNFKIIILVLVVVCALGYAICMILSGPILDLLYPQWAEESKEVLWITTMSMCFSAMGNVVNSFVLKDCDLKWQGIVNALVMLVFLISCVTLINFYGLIGYCIGVLLAYFMRMVMLTIIYMKSANAMEGNELEQ